VLGFNSSNGILAPNTGSIYYASGVAAGGTPTNTAGGNGHVVIVY
jgi:hypothetical protein